MDFIKNLHISDIVEDKNHSSDDTIPAPPPPTAIGASHPHPSSSPLAVDNSTHGSSSSILDKIEEALNNHVEHNDKRKDSDKAPAPAPHAVPVHAPANDATHPHGEQTDGTFLRKIAELMGGSASVVEAAPTLTTQAHDNNKKEEKENLLSKLGDAISGRKTPPPPPPDAHKYENILHKLGDAISGKKTPPPLPAPVKDENILHKLGDAISGKKTPPPAPVPVAHKDENILHKLGDAISGKKTPPQPPAPVPVAHKDENVLHKLGDAISGKTPPPPPPPPAPVKDENILHKLGDVLSGASPAAAATAAPVPEKHHNTNINMNIVDKLTEAVTGKTEHHQQQHQQHVAAKPESFVHQLSEVVLKKDEEDKDKKRVERPHGLGLADRLNSALGGGSKGELEEGRLDKAIDMFQEHVLKQGPQNNESAMEQAKDKEIANMIRTAVGKEAK